MKFCKSDVWLTVQRDSLWIIKTTMKFCVYASVLIHKRAFLLYTEKCYVKTLHYIICAKKHHASLDVPRSDLDTYIMFSLTLMTVVRHELKLCYRIQHHSSP